MVFRPSTARVLKNVLARVKRCIHVSREICSELQAFGTVTVDFVCGTNVRRNARLFARPLLQLPYLYGEEHTQHDTNHKQEDYDDPRNNQTILRFSEDIFLMLTSTNS